MQLKFAQGVRCAGSEDGGARLGRMAGEERERQPHQAEIDQRWTAAQTTADKLDMTH
jgi:hypothetical protein